MPSDDYAPIGGGGALKLKGAKVSKKKKKSKEKADLAKNLADGEGTVAKTKSPATNDNDDGEAEKRSEGEDDAMLGSRKTEAEKRYEEVKRKRLLQTAESSGSRPGLLKTHKERVEELNTYLSKLSEHHDMPKIGPG